MLNATVNDYLDVEGENVAVGRGGGGGRVELYGINGLLALDNLTTYEPPATPGDLLGWAIDLSGPTLIAGAPGTNADAGAVFSTDVGPVDEPIVVDSLLDTVADDGLCTLREAITAANSDTAANGCIGGSGADTINFAVSGTIVLDTPPPDHHERHRDRRRQRRHNARRAWRERHGDPAYQQRDRGAVEPGGLPG